MPLGRKRALGCPGKRCAHGAEPRGGVSWSSGNRHVLLPRHASYAPLPPDHGKLTTHVSRSHLPYRHPRPRRVPGCLRGPAGRRPCSLLSCLLPMYWCPTSSAAGVVMCHRSWFPLLVFPKYKSMTAAAYTSPPGFDVWLGNVRGNSLSRSHKWLTPDDPRFWEWSYDEMAKVCTGATLNILQLRSLCHPQVVY